MENNKNIAYLDNIRKTQGCEKLMESFDNMCEKEKENAIHNINSENLEFVTLYILIPVIEEKDIKENLSDRNKNAIDICSKIKERKCDFSEEEKTKEKALEWMLATGKNDDGFSTEFGEIIDMAASLLIHIYKNKRVYNHIADIIFQRNRKDGFTHDLVWALFDSQDIRAIEAVARYLKSNVKEDIKLAANILNIDENLVERGEGYLKYVRWLGENRKYIKFTGENYQQTSNPNIFSLDLASKYIGKVISDKEILTDIEKKCVEWFDALDDAAKERLAKFSHMLSKRNTRFWKEWITKPIGEQIEIALKYMGGKL